MHTAASSACLAIQPPSDNEREQCALATTTTGKSPRSPHHNPSSQSAWTRHCCAHLPHKRGNGDGCSDGRTWLSPTLQRRQRRAAREGHHCSTTASRQRDVHVTARTSHTTFALLQQWSVATVDRSGAGAAAARTRSQLELAAAASGHRNDGIGTHPHRTTCTRSLWCCLYPPRRGCEENRATTRPRANSKR